MFRKENPWSEWLGDGIFAHPNAPCRNGGTGRHIGARRAHGGAISPWSPAGRFISPREAAQGYAEFELERVLSGLFFCDESWALLSLAREAFGQGSFSERFSQALDSDSQASASGLFGLKRVMVQAELHEHLHGAAGWKPFVRFSSIRDPQLWEVGHHLRLSSNTSHREKFANDATTRDALLKELRNVFNQLTPVFVEARAKLDPRTEGSWQQYNKLAKTQLSRNDAGWYLGKVCADVLTVLSSLQRRGDFHARITAAAPVLAGYAAVLKDAAGASGAPVAETGGSSAPAVDLRARIPFHNDDALTPDVEKGTFKTERPVDMDNLSPEEKRAVIAMGRQGRGDRELQKQLLSSADTFEVTEAKKGDVVYGFTSTGRPKGQNSMYWMSEKDYTAVKAKHCKDGVWDREAVKNELALPCYNRANAVVKCEVLEDHTAIRSHIGPATERVGYSNDAFSSGMYTKPMPGGGYQYTPSASKISTETIIS